MKRPIEFPENENLESLEYLCPGDLKPWPRNARMHSLKQLRQLAQSIEQFGFTNPCSSSKPRFHASVGGIKQLVVHSDDASLPAGG